jgi:hypothetical protein
MIPMEPLSPTQKLFHVVVVLGIGAAATGCSAGTSTGGQDASVSATDGAAGDASGDASLLPDGGSSGADACAGWAPCC